MIATNFGKVAVFLGGESAEREISLKTGQAVYTALQRQKVEVIAIDTATAFLSQLTDIERVFIALHGRGGEDGSIQGLLDCLKIPYTGSGVLGSALAMDKLRTKQIWQATNLPTPPCEILQADSDFAQIAARLGLPLMVKPTLEGSSVGMTKVHSVAELQQAWQTAAQYQCEVMVETFMTGKEYTVSILEQHALPIIRLETSRAFYDFTAKYNDDHTLYHCPCGLTAAEEAHLQTLALAAFQAVEGRGWGRVDMIQDQYGQLGLLEVNTVPGLTDHSLVPMAARHAGIEFDELVLRILATATLT